MIVKVQAPLAGAEQVLIYDRTRKVEVQFPYSDYLRKLMNGSAKRYFEAALVDEALVLGKEVPDPGW